MYYLLHHRLLLLVLSFCRSAIGTFHGMDLPTTSKDGTNFKTLEKITLSLI